MVGNHNNHNRDQNAANSVTNIITTLPSAVNITLTNENAVNAAKAAFDRLTPAQQALISSENKTKLTEVVSKIAQKKAIKKATDALKNVPLAADITEANAFDARKKANLAKKVVGEALHLGALESDLPGLENLDAVFVKLEEFGLSLEEAIEIANIELEAVMPIGKVTASNAEKVRSIYLSAFMAIATAKSLGAVDADFNQEALAKYKTLPGFLLPFDPERPVY